MFGIPGNHDNGLFDEFRRMQREMDQLFGATPWPSSIRSASRETYPPVNIGSNENQVDVYLFAAGLNPSALDITIQQNLLTIAGERDVIREEGANYYRKERFGGTFRRVINLPDDVDPDKVDASYHDGVLHISIQRQAASKPRQIQVN